MWETAFSSTYSIPKTSVKIQMSVNVCSVRPPLKGLLAFVIAREGRHISTIPKMYNNIRLRIKDELSEPLGSSIVVFVMCV
jgi:hypothetical protein